MKFFVNFVKWFYFQKNIKNLSIFLNGFQYSDKAVNLLKIIFKCTILEMSIFITGLIFVKFMNKNLKYKFYRKIIISFIIIVTITILSLSGTLFSLFSSSAAEEIDSNLKSMLTQVSYTSDIVYNQVLNLGNQLNTDNDICTYFYPKNSDPDTIKVINYNIYLKLSRIQSVYPFIYSIGVYNAYNKINIDSRGVPIDNNFINFNSERYLYFYPRKADVVGSNGVNSVDLLTFILYPDFSLSSSSKSAIIINIDQAYILNTIRRISGSSQDTDIFVMDSGGQVLSHTDSSYFMKDFSKNDYAKRILNENKPQGSFIENIDNKKQLVTYVKSGQLNWYFVSVRPYRTIIYNIEKLKVITAAVALALLIFGIFISMVMTGFIYNPMKSLMDKIASNSYNTIPPKAKLDEYEIISEAFSKSQEIEKNARSVIKENYLISLLTGSSGESTDSDAIVKDIERELLGPYFCCFLLKIDNLRKLNDAYDTKRLNFTNSSLYNISFQQFKDYSSIDIVKTEKDEVVLLVQLAKDIMDKKIIQSLNEMQTAINSQFNITISISIGDIVYSRNDIHVSYKSCIEYMKYRLFYGYGCTIDSNNVKEHFNTNIKYPVLIEKKTIESIKSGNRSLAEDLIGDFVKSVDSVSYYQAINYCNQFITAIFRYFENSVDLLNYNMNAMGSISNSETLEDISQTMIDFCLKVISLLEEKNSTAAAQKYKIIIDRVQNYVKENYSNQNLSLEFVSDIVGLSAGYLGKLFKSNTSISFNEYLNSIRLEKAKVLLSKTSEPASKICEAVGIFNVSYFSTLFKKYYGLTPSQYREQI